MLGSAGKKLRGGKRESDWREGQQRAKGGASEARFVSTRRLRARRRKEKRQKSNPCSIYEIWWCRLENGDRSAQQKRGKRIMINAARVKEHDFRKPSLSTKRKRE